jgi:hypothetical protein
MSQTFKQRAQVIQSETVANANTASRVGGLLTDMADQFDTAFANYFDFSSGSVTTIANINTWVKLNTSTTLGFSRNGLAHSNNRITRTGATTRVFQLEGITSVTSGNNNVIHVAFFKNGALWPCSEQENTTGVGGRATAVPFHCLIELAENDFIEVYVKNATGANNITLDNVNVIVKQL